MVKEFQRKFVLAPADKTANNLMVVHRHRCQMAAKFGVFVDEDHSKLPTLNWLPKLHKRPYNFIFIANSSSCNTTELSIILTSYLTAIINYFIKCCEIYFGLLKTQVRFLTN